jgi:predicted DNA binding CopG/RHH family protein
MNDRKKRKHFPKQKSDKEAEDFVTDVNLTEYNFSGFEPIKFEDANTSARINMRLPESLLDRIKAVAEEKHIPYTRYIRQILEAVVTKEKPQH